MLSSETDEWLSGPTFASEPLCRALGLSFGGQTRHQAILDGLAEQFGLDTSRFGDAGYYAMSELRGPLERAMEAGPWTVFKDGDTGRQTVIATEVASCLDVGDMLDASIQFGWHRTRIDAHNPSLFDVEGLVRAAFVKRLGQAIFGVMEKWRKANVWSAVLFPRPQRQAGPPERDKAPSTR